MRSAVHDPIGYVAHKLWRIIFFPIAMLALLIMGGMKGLVTFAAFALIVTALRMVIIPGVSLIQIAADRPILDR